MAVGLSATSPAQKLTFLLFTSAEGKESPLPFWGPSQSFGFSLLPLPVSGDLRLLSTNTCWYPLCDPHSLLTVTFLTGFHCSFQREDSINLTSIVSAGYHVTVYSVRSMYVVASKGKLTKLEGQLILICIHTERKISRWVFFYFNNKLSFGPSTRRCQYTMISFLRYFSSRRSMRGKRFFYPELRASCIQGGNQRNGVMGVRVLSSKLVCAARSSSI